MDTLRDVAQLVDWASEIAALKLADSLPRRWRHVQGVAAKARSIAHVAPSSDQDLLVAAAWLHDIGYAPDIVGSGLHSLDGARWLRDQGQPARLASLVAYHSCAAFEAEERGLAEQLRDEFEQEHTITANALWYADMTTGPDSQSFTVDARLAEIRSRYGPDDVVTRFWEKAAPALYNAAARVEAALQPM
jgi:HD superfamily phosphodiesterase